MIVFAIEPLKLVWNSVMVLANEHWKETEGYRHNQPFCPSFERYKQYEDAGWFALFTARDGTKLVGYAGMYISQSQHTQQKIATEDTYYLLKEYRKGRNAIEFYKFIERECIKSGAVEMMMTVKVTNGAARILEHLQFSKTAIQYTKQLNNGADSTSIAVNEETHIERRQLS